jgi:hypothetical protein
MGQRLESGQTLRIGIPRLQSLGMLLCFAQPNVYLDMTRHFRVALVGVCVLVAFTCVVWMHNGGHANPVALESRSHKYLGDSHALSSEEARKQVHELRPDFQDNQVT